MFVVDCLQGVCQQLTVAHMGEWRGADNVLLGRPEGKRQFERPRRRWEYTIKMNLWILLFCDVLVDQGWVVYSKLCKTNAGQKNSVTPAVVILLRVILCLITKFIFFRQSREDVNHKNEYIKFQILTEMTVRCLW